MTFPCCDHGVKDNITLKLIQTRVNEKRNRLKWNWFWSALFNILHWIWLLCVVVCHGLKHEAYLICIKLNSPAIISIWWCVLDMHVCVTQQCWHTCVLRLLSLWSTLRVSEVAVPQGLCYSDVKRGEHCFINVAGLTAFRIIVFQALKGLALYFDTFGSHTRFPILIFQTVNIEADRVQLSLMFLFVAWLALISPACWLRAWHVSEVLASEKKHHHMTYWGIMRQLVGSNWKNFCVRWPVPTLKSAKSCARCQVPVKRNYRASALFGLSSPSSGGRLLQAHSAL